ncbi:hypothetical protein V8E52_010688 [Russula decolorans]
MSHGHPTAAPSSNFQLIINNALKEYEKRTRTDLLAHPLASQFQTCYSPSSIRALLQKQVQGPNQSRNSDERWTKWLDPTVNVLHAFSATLGAGVSLLFPPANVIFAGIGVLLSTAKDVRASQDTLPNILERIDMFFRRLEIYTEARLTEMMDIIVRIMVEVIRILGIATKEIKRSLTKKYLNKLIGRTDMEDALKRLDFLTREEAWMAIAQNMRDMRNLHERVTEVIDGGKEAKKVMKQIANDVDQIKWKQSREITYKWLSPPDQSTNHNTASDTLHKKPATWFFQDRIYQEWKLTGSLLWVNGKPGSGKTVLSSTVIQDIEAICRAGNALMGYFYFDFQDANKQRLRDLICSLLTQLSARSAPRCDILSDLYSARDEGKNQPSDNDLTECLKTMLTLPNQPPTYLIIDALDESPDTPGIPSPRVKVLRLVKELIELRLPNLRIYVTSRPEIGIQKVLEPLVSHRVSLDDQNGQKEDIADYIRSVVYSDSGQIMKGWRTEDKELVIKTLSERADGMFQWAFCLLEILQDCLPQSIQRTLDKLPKSLDDTYDRILKGIKEPNREDAHRLLQCVVAAIRPLRVEELAEVLAVDFDDEEGIPKLNPTWRWEDQEQALLASCSNLIAIVKSGQFRVVKFSHSSVKEFLTSPRLATSSEHVMHYHIAPEPAHMVLAQACMSILLRSDDHSEQNGIGNCSPLAGYAAEHWVAHAQFERVSSYLRNSMRCLFDPDKPYFAAWCRLYDIDTPPPTDSTSFMFTLLKPGASSLYYAALCGFQDLVKHLITQYPQHVNASGGFFFFFFFFFFLKSINVHLRAYCPM